MDQDATPETVPSPVPAGTVYAGFWLRVLASLIDGVLMVIIMGLVDAVLGTRFLSFEDSVWSNDDAAYTVAMCAAMVWCWHTWQATPGKMALRLKIIDARDGGKTPLVRLIVRVLGQYISLLAFGLGYLWVIWDPRKQSWHDKMAGTLVVRVPRDSSAEFKLPG